jgi:hypothetical protein
MIDRSAPIPAVAAILGAAGLLPFAAGAITAWLAPADVLVAIPASFILVAYAAVILAFLGGAHWGLASAALIDRRHPSSPRLFLWSVVPALIGWVACFLSLPLSVAVLILAFAVILVLDRQVTTGGLAPAWWWRLRVRLTLAVIATLVVALAGFARAGLLFDP